MDSASTGRRSPWQPAPGSRQAVVLNAVRERGSVRVTELAQELRVTPVTVRRDVAMLADAGLVQRVHGGATALEGTDGTPAWQPGPRTQTGSVGVLVPSLDFYWPDVVRGAEEEASRLGLRLLLRGSVYHARDERADIARLLDAGVKGVLLAPTMSGPGGDHIRTWLAEAPVPVVLMERAATVGPVQRAVESVLTDHAGGAAMAVNHLANLGHRRIGVVLNENSPHVHQIRRGWQEACAERGLSTQGVTDIALPDHREESFEPTINAVVGSALETGCTALIVHSDPEALRILQNAEELGVDIPTDLSVISYDDQVAALSTPALSAMRTPRRTIGRTAVKLLAERLAEPARPMHRVQVSPTLVVRDSSGPPGGADGVPG